MSTEMRIQSCNKTKFWVKVTYHLDTQKRNLDVFSIIFFIHQQPVVLDCLTSRSTELTNPLEKKAIFLRAPC